MEIGKVPNSILKDRILNKLNNKRKEVILGPGIGEDCCAIEFGESACVLTMDPVTGAVNQVGHIAVHVACNDIASSGVEPIGLLVTVLAPPQTTADEIEFVMADISSAAESLNVDIVGGHTEVTSAVNRFVITVTGIGKVLREKLITTSGANIGDDIIMTKTVGLEGTAIIASDLGNVLLEKLDNDCINNAKGFFEKISVVTEGIIAGNHGVSSMHDVTEGGILGAVWEMAQASGVGVLIYKEKILIEKETEKICEVLGLDPLKLISSGCMLITCKNGEELVKRMYKGGITATIIGKVTDGKNKSIICEGIANEISEPASDELYKVIQRI